MLFAKFFCSHFFCAKSPDIHVVGTTKAYEKLTLSFTYEVEGGAEPNSTAAAANSRRSTVEK